MDYNKLGTFLKIAEVGSITAAARELHRSQSAISQQVQILEDELGLALLERKGGKVLLSKHGEQVRELAARHLWPLNDGIVDLQAELQQVEGVIRLGVLNDYGCDVPYGSIIGSFSASYPQVRFELVEGTSRSLEVNLLNNDIDLSFQVYFQQPELVRQIPVNKSWHSLYSTKVYLDSYKKISNYRDIVEADLIDLTPDFICIGTFVRKNAPKVAQYLLHRKPNVAAPNHNVMKQIVLSGYGIAILPDYFVAAELKKKQLVRVMPKAKPVYAGLDLAHRAHRSLRLAEKLFIKHVESWVREHKRPNTRG